MNTRLIEGQIVFYYTHHDLFEDVQHQSAFMCKNIVSKEGDDLMERYAITDDEEGMFKICLRETIPDIYDTLKGLMHGIDGAITESITQSEIRTSAPSEAFARLFTDDGPYLLIRMNDNGAYNPNDIQQVDTALLSTLTQGVLFNFYTRVMHPELTKLAATTFTGQNQALAARTMPLRKKTVFP